ncbi:MAG TPA: phosphate-starvation-inducible PsiE family protein [Thermoanaerobaculia bacterium]
MAADSKPISREWIAGALSAVEDIVYAGLGLLLAASAIALMIHGAYTVFQDLANGALPQNITVLLDRILLVLLVVELLYTIQVSIRERALVPEPFLLVGVIAAIRRVLVLTAEFSHAPTASRDAFERSMIELAVLTLLVLVLVVLLILLRKTPIGIKRV